MNKLNYKAFVCKEQHYYTYGANVFLECVRKWGLKPTDNLLDIGCGSLRVGKHLIPFLEPEKYCGVEPEQKYLNDGLEWEVSEPMLKLKKPSFIYNHDFDFTFSFISPTTLLSRYNKPDNLLIKFVSYISAFLSEYIIFHSNSII